MSIIGVETRGVIPFIAGFLVCSILQVHAAQVIPDPTPIARIRYINPDIPDFAAPQYKGQRYEALVPATFDPAERATLAVNALTELVNPNVDFEPYWHIDLLADPPLMASHFAGCTAIHKFFQILPVTRTVCGSDQNLDREYQMMRNMLKSQGPDGMVYLPVMGRPWGIPRGENVAFNHSGEDEYHWGGIFRTGWALGGFSIYALKDPSGPWREAAIRLADAVKRATIVEGDTAYLFALAMEPGWEATKPEEKPMKYKAVHSGQVAHGLAQYGRLLNDPEATELAAKIFRHVMRDSEYFGPDGEYLPDRYTDPGIHFHSHSRLSLQCLEVVQTSGDRDLYEMALKGFKWGMDRVAETHPLVGFFPEFGHTEVTEQWMKTYGGPFFHAETCEVVDMIMAAVLFSKLGEDYWDEDYWDEADRWIRNQFAENQLTWTGWLDDGHFEPPARVTHGGQVIYNQTYFTTDNVVQRAIGGFAGWGGFNDMQSGVVPCTIQNCCPPSGARCLYFVWKNMIDFDEQKGRLRVHLLYNRASEWADIDSHIPYQGRVDVKAKQTLNLDIRLPEWAKPEDARATVNGKERPLSIDGRYARLGTVEKGRKATLRFPIRERTEIVKVHDKHYTLVIRGSSVVSVDPPGKYCPYYQRGHTRGGQTLWRKVTRFVPDDELNW